MDEATHRLDNTENQLPQEEDTTRFPPPNRDLPRACLRCGHTMVNAEIGSVRSGRPGTDQHPLTVRIETDGVGFWGLGYLEAYCLALVCTNCGYTELQTVGPDKLLKP